MKSKNLLAIALVFVFAATANAQLFGGRRHSDYVKKSELHRAVLQQQVYQNMIAIQANSDRIRALEMLILQNRIEAALKEKLQTTTTVIQPAYRQKPVYQRIENLPPARVYPVRPVPYQGGKR